MTSMSQTADQAAPIIDFFPNRIASRQSAEWRGLRAEILQVTNYLPFEYRFNGSHHLLIAAEYAERDDGETTVDGLPKSNLQKFSGKLTFIPAGYRFHGWQKPRVLARSVYLYIDPRTPLLPPELRFDETAFKPRLFFDDRDLWETALKLKRQVEAPSTPLYAEALEAVLAYELLRMNQGARPAGQIVKGGLAAWQKKRVTSYIEEHLAESISILALADIAGLSPFHFSRAFKQSFGAPPHRYHMIRRIEQAKLLLAKHDASVTQVGLKVGFSETSSFTAAFRRLTHQTPSEFRRRFE